MLDVRADGFAAGHHQHQFDPYLTIILPRPAYRLLLLPKSQTMVPPLPPVCRYISMNFSG
ncbi:MAG: hypothetical protein M3139_00455 [Bacteroidota bacterium]|nr:hypothetical protein [Bacteroidota bacterium]